MRYSFLLLFAILVFAGLRVMLTPAHPDALSSGEAQIGGTFMLNDTHGHPVKENDFRGRLMLVYMGYSRCPDICPATLATISDALKSLGPDADKVAVLFISLDPERDTPEALRQFLSAFNPHIIGLTGSRQAVNQAAQVYKVYRKQVAAPDTGSYIIDHSGFLYLMDRQGKYLTHFGTDVKANELVKVIQMNLR